MTTFYENKNYPITAWNDTSLTNAPHLHNHLEVVCMLKGASYAVSDSIRAELNEGGIFITFPNQVHFYPPKNDCKEMENILIIFSPAVCSEFKDLFRRMTPVFPVVNADRLDPETIELAKKICKAKNSDSAYKEIITRGYLIAFLGKLFQSMEFREEKKSDGLLLKNILNYCNQHYTEPLSLDRLSRELNIGKCYISHILSEQLRISFSDYVNGLRINDAIQRLTKEVDAPITEIAYDCGFSSTRTFNRAFQKYTGKTPREYRKDNINQKISPINFYITG